ncbi:DUF3540 domain-containing protein [uncultured Variovorax sp.]|uniref:DUF3540 domain-containing protein n=1 Tax=uncultured Variovorax sp. TaxID=114708 RepID=UPI0025D0E545|nr:DUF3540 domain-containing protein [uncultured Variovorax sp.]
MTMASRTPSSAPAPLAGDNDDSGAESALAPLLRKATGTKQQSESAAGGIVMATVSTGQAEDGLFEVTLAGSRRTLRCRRAASCLLLPAPGDTVMVAGPHDEALYLIAVVAQADCSRTTLAVDGDLRLQSRHGGVAIQGAGAIDLQSDTTIATRSPQWTLAAQRAQCTVSELDYQGGEVRFSVLVSRFVGRACEVVLDRLSLLTRSSFRITEEVEQVRAGQIDMQASRTLRLHAKNTLVTSKELVKVDAEQIHMG